MSIWRVGVALLALAGYALLSHALMVRAPAHSSTLLLLFAPLLIALAVAGIRRRHLPTLAAAALLLVVLAAMLLGGGAGDAGRLYVMQHAGIHLVLAWSFGFTLRRGSVPLITRLAERVHVHFPPAMRDYTRRLTAGWAAYFVAMVVISLALYAWAPWSWWSLFGNLVSPLAAAAFFVGEAIWRRWRHPEFEPASLAQALGAYFRAGQPSK